jgi:CRISPR-associated endonuclease/helicase Cas3
MPNALAYWGKARPRLGAANPFHPAAYHSLDVAACARVLLARNALLCARLCALLGLNADDCLPLLTALVALHDIGKFSRPFQAKCPELWPTELGAVQDVPTEPHHDAAGFLLWRECLANDLADKLPQRHALTPLARAIYGHHGVPAAEHGPLGVRALCGRAGLAAAGEFAREVVNLLLPKPVMVPLTQAALNRASYAVAGFTVIADWIGSSQRWFPYTAPDYSLADYWQRIQPQAERAVAAAGLLPVASAPLKNYAGLTGVAGWTPSDMQAWAEMVPLADGPALYVIEDATGSGKTEAALMLAHRLIAAGRADGLYVALPTMATADGMFSRLAAAYRNLFAEGSPSLVLAHGSRDLNEGFSTSIMGDGESRCAAWIADDRRKAFLAQVGVGTVDQAILSVLPSRHQSLRLIGLAQRVLVLDEVHAYDAYVSQEITRLLEFHAALGGSAILLSATLPADAKRRLSAAYGGTAVAFSAAYPLATLQSATGLIETPCAPRPDTVRDVPIAFLTDPDEGLARAATAASAGQAVLYIRNTVADAISSSEQWGRAMLFHARFAMCDRLARQAEVLKTFGRDSTPDQRRGRLLIATQVVEQSLDLDFDLIVTDLVPVDLIIQRAGRLWRHLRPRPAGALRELVVVGPGPDAQASATWLRDALPRTSYVYEDHARIWLTAETLRATGMISAPDGLRPMIEHVYGVTPRVPEGLRATLRRITSSMGAERGQAAAASLSLADGYARLGPWLSEDHTPTRLGEPTTTLRLAVIRDGAAVPWAALTSASTDPHRLWALSEVRVQVYHASQESLAPEHVAPVAAAKRDWPAWEREDVVMVVLSEAGGGVWRGQAATERSTVELAYCRDMGLR